MLSAHSRFAMALSTRCWLALFLTSVGAPCCSSQGASDAAFALTWASQPAFANETVLLWGGGLAGIESVTVQAHTCIAGRSMDPLSSSAVDVTNTAMKVVLPAGLPDAHYTVCAQQQHTSGGGAKSCIDINVPDLWWRRGDVNMTHATAGGWVRTFGRGFGNLSASEPSRLPAVSLQLCPSRTDSQGAGVERRPLACTDGTVVHAINGSSNDEFFVLPETLAPGWYSISLSRCGAGFPVPDDDSRLYVSPAGTPKGSWAAARSQRVLNVNTTEELFAALNTSEHEGGAIIQLARGEYLFTNESLVLPPWTVLRGTVGMRSRVTLRWDTRGVEPAAVPACLICGQATFAVEDLTIYTLGLYNNVIRDAPGLPRSSHVRVTRIRMRADNFFRWGRTEAAYANGSFSDLFSRSSYGMYMNGDNAEITDNDFYTTASGIYFGSHGEDLRNANLNVIARNVIQFGSDCYQVDSSSHIIFEQNRCVGVNLFSHGSAMGATYGGPSSSFIFFAANHIQFIFGYDQEEMTLDGGSNPYHGPVIVSPDGINLTMLHDPDFDKWCPPQVVTKWCPKIPCPCVKVNTNWTGSAAYVLAGAGQGQMRTVRLGGIQQNRTWMLEKPFGGAGGGVPLGEDSVVSFGARRERCIYRDNVFADGGAMQLWGLMWHAVVANNVGTRFAGFVVTNFFPYSSSYFIETLNNRVTEGVAYYPSSAGFSIDGSYNASSDFTHPVVSALVYRGNSVDNGAWAMDGAVSDVLIEGNVMSYSDHGLVVDQNCKAWRRCNQTARILLRNNEGLPWQDLAPPASAGESVALLRR